MRIALAIALAVWAGTGCSLLLATDSTAHKCNTDADCARYPDAVCDNSRQECIPRLPYVNGGADADAPDGDAPDSAPNEPMCELSFDNRNRVPFDGPDGGLRPLPEGP